MLDELKDHELVYLATPYSRYPAALGGIVGAFKDAAALTGKLLKIGVRAYSPIAHTHPIAEHASIDPYDHSVWLPFDEAIMGKAGALVVAKMATWEESKGIAHEIEFFERSGKPVYYLNVSNFKIEEPLRESA